MQEIAQLDFINEMFIMIWDEKKIVTLLSAMERRCQCLHITMYKITDH